MQTCSFALFAGRPDVSAMILDDLFHNGQPDSASAFHGVAGCVRPVKPLKYIAEVFCRDSLAVVLDFYPDGIHLIQQTNIDHAFLFCPYFDAVANDIVDDFLSCSGSAIIRVSAPPDWNSSAGYFFDSRSSPTSSTQSAKKFCNVYPVEIVRNTIIINTGIIGQLIDQPIHVVRFCVKSCADICPDAPVCPPHRR